jgi:hypothetical protein
LALVLALGHPALAQAEGDPREAARQHYQRGVELANGGDYKAALGEFDQAYQASPNFAVLYNVGQAEVALGRPRKAIEALTRYLHDGGEQVPPERRTQVARQIALLESTFADLSVTTEPSGARVTLDGAELGAETLAQPLRLTAGTHIVTATRPGAAPVSRVVTLAEGQRQSVTLVLPDLPPAPPPARPEPVPAPPLPAPGPARFPVGYVLVGAGVAVGGVALAHYAWNAGRVNELRAEQAALATDTAPGRRERQLANNDLADSIDRASVVTVTLGVVGGALVAGGVAWELLAGGASAPERERVSLVTPSLLLGPGTVGARWSGAW